jgi:hypothetical protein
MPLHDWARESGWDGVHQYWLPELARHIKPQLPAEYRVHLGTVPTVSLETVAAKPDVSVRHWENGIGDRTSPTVAEIGEPEVEVATLTVDPQRAVLVTFHGQLVAVIEVVSPANKDRPSSRATYTARYLGYLKSLVHLLLVDVHQRPFGFSFADALATELAIRQDPLPTPMAITYRVGEPAPNGGSFLGIWSRRLRVGEPLPTLPLPLSVHRSVTVDLEATYSRAAADAYLT